MKRSLLLRMNDMNSWQNKDPNHYEHRTSNY